MNGIDFLDGLSDINMEYLKEADVKPVNRIIHRRCYISMAACLALMLISGVFLNGGVWETPQLEKPADGVASMIGSAMGLFWIMLAIGVAGIIISLIILIRDGKKDK